MRLPGRRVCLCISLLAPIAFIGCDDDDAPGDTTIGGVEAARLAEDAVGGGEAHAGALVGSDLVEAVECNPSDFEGSLRAWIVDCELRLLVLGGLGERRTTEGQFLVDDRTGAVTYRD